MRTHERNCKLPKVKKIGAEQETVPPSNPESKHSCQFCGKEFEIMPALQRHLKLHLLPKPFSCTKCPAVFRLEANLKIHLQRHTTFVNYPCTICAEGFTNAADLEEHTESHGSGVLCPKCGELSASDTALRDHIKNNHGLHKCIECDLKFEAVALLKKHMESHSNRIYQCGDCDMVCKTIKWFKEHNLKRHGKVVFK